MRAIFYFLSIPVFRAEAATASRNSIGASNEFILLWFKQFLYHAPNQVVQRCLHRLNVDTRKKLNMNIGRFIAVRRCRRA